jgi:hypothetical protein
MNGGQQVTYAFDSRPAKLSYCQPSLVGDPIPRIARLIDAAPRNLQSRLGVHLRGGGLQSGADEESCGGSLRISSGRSVPESQEIGDSGIQAPRKARKKLVGEGEEPSPSIFFS